MLDADGGDPQVVLGDRFSLLLESQPEPRINLGRRKADIQHLGSRDQIIDPAQVLGRSLRLNSAESKLPHDGYRQKDRGKPLNPRSITVTLIENGNRDR